MCLGLLFLVPVHRDLEGLTRRASRTAYEESDQYTMDKSYLYMYLKSDVERKYVLITCTWNLILFCLTMTLHLVKCKRTNGFVVENPER